MQRRILSRGMSRKTQAKFDIPLLIAVYGLSLFGVICIAIATFDPDNGTDLSLLNYVVNSNSGRWQAIFVLVSMAVVAVVIAVPMDFYKRLTKLIYYAVLALLLITLAAATAVSGINAWLTMGAGRTLQPCEFAKLAILFMLAKELSSKEKPMGTVKDFIRTCMILGVPAVITLLQGETGTVIVMGFMFIVMMFFAGVDNRIFFSIVGLLALAVGLLFGYAIISQSTNYRILRILSFMDPSKYSSSGGYQILQSQMAIGSGGLNGIGAFVTGSVSQLDYVPEDHTDFIFSAIGEAFGFKGCCCVILVYMFICLHMLRLAYYTGDKYSRLIIVGVMGMLFLHAFENMAMTIGLMPITGIPLPFLSYGGSNYMTNIVGVALVLNATRSRSAANDLINGHFKVQ